MAASREHGEDGGWGELMDLAEALPGKFTSEIRDDTIVYTDVDFDGTTWEGVQRIPKGATVDDPVPPTKWEVTHVGHFWASRGVKIGPSEGRPG